LAAHDIDALIEPMMAINQSSEAQLDLTGAQAVLLTSANGARALDAAAPNETAARALPVLTVGDATADAARGAGFTDVTSAGGDVDDLAALAVARLRTGGGRLIHIAGQTVAGDLLGRLTNAGFEIARVSLYEAVSASALSPEARDALDGQTLAGVVFFSPRTANLFVKLVVESGLAPRVRTITAFCLSDAVAGAAAALSWREIVVARAPRLDALVATVTSDLAAEGHRAG
jgi:uroporphyrinogen-III synthase